MLLKRMIGNQSANPSGFFGRFVVRMMARTNFDSNKWMVSLLDIKDNDHVLEIGFGPGTAIKEILKIAKNSHVSGIDISKLMVDQVTRLNQKAVTKGRLDLRLGEATSMPWDSNNFDKALAVNVIYLWPILKPVFIEIIRVLKPNGILAMYLPPIEMMDALGFSDLDAFTLHTQEDVLKACKEAGFVKTETASTQMGEGTGICIMAWK